MNIIIEVNKALAAAFEKSGYDARLGVAVNSNRPDLCEYVCNGAMTKPSGKNPREVSEEICQNIANEIFSAEVAGPGFINISIKNDYLESLLKNKKSFREFIDAPKNEKIIVDYGGPNIAKPLHVGHLRAANIGEAAKRIAKFLGADVCGDTHHGDWGLPMGLIITELLLINNGALDFEINIEELNQIYPRASQKSKTDPEFAQKARVATARLQNKESPYYDIWKKFCKISIADIKKTYDKLNVHFELWMGESDVEPYIKRVIDILKEKNLLYESEGAQVADVREESDKTEIPPIIILKSDDSALYATTDLATIYWRAQNVDPDAVWYFVDQRQGMHFEQVFRCARKAGIVSPKTELCHAGFGTMNGKDKKPFKTRDGGVLELNSLIETAFQTALAKVNENIKNNAKIPDSEKSEIAEKVAIAAIKFGDLYNHRLRDYIFDIEKFVSFEGKTGPYILYTIARINSIFDNFSELPENFSLKIYSPIEKELVLKILSSENILLKCYEEKAPNYLCERVYEIAAVFNKFYNENKIITETDRQKQSSWLALLALTKECLETLLDLLAIKPVKSM